MKVFIFLFTGWVETTYPEGRARSTPINPGEEEEEAVEEDVATSLQVLAEVEDRVQTLNPKIKLVMAVEEEMGYPLTTHVAS